MGSHPLSLIFHGEVRAGADVNLHANIRLALRATAPT
jgi:hypothetical protein